MSDIDLIPENELMLLSIFIDEIHDKSNTTLLNFRLLNQSIMKREIDPIFAFLQSILFNSAQISLIFFPTCKKFSMRGKRLRRAVGLADELEFLENRKIRNDIAHMDERLHEWRKESPNGNIIRKMISDRGIVFGNSVTAGDIFERYIPSEKIFIFRGNEYDMAKLFHCIQAISEKTDALNKLHWMSDEFRQHFKN